MDSVPNCDGNSNGKMGLMATSEGVHIAPIMAWKNICKKSDVAVIV